MTIESCDNCRGQIKGYSGLALRLHLTRIDICRACARLIIKAFDEQYLLSPRLVQKLQLEFEKSPRTA